MKDLVIIGAGGSGREIAFLAKEIVFNYSDKEFLHLVGFVDDNPLSQNSIIDGTPVIGKIEDLLNIKKETYVICSIANCNVKRSIIKKIKQNPFLKFATLVHPTVILSKTVKLGEGCIVYPYSVMTVDIEIGNHVLIGPKTGVGHGTKIEDYCSLLWNVNISGDVTIEEAAFIGTNATVLQGLKIGTNSTIGAGAVVTKDIPSYLLAVGVPAKIK